MTTRAAVEEQAQDPRTSQVPPTGTPMTFHKGDIVRVEFKSAREIERWMNGERRMGRMGRAMWAW